MPDDVHGFFDYLMFEKTSGTDETQTRDSSNTSSGGNYTGKRSNQKQNQPATQTNSSATGIGCATVFIIVAVIYIIVKLACG